MQLEVQMAGCSIAALGGTSESVTATEGAYGWSSAYRDILELRRKYDALNSADLLKAAKATLSVLELLERNDKTYYAEAGNLRAAIRSAERERKLMGEIADMMLDGELCEGCGEYLGGRAPGYPRYCSKECAQGRSADMAPTNAPQRNKPVKCIVKGCNGKFATDAAFNQHYEAKHVRRSAEGGEG